MPSIQEVVLEFEPLHILSHYIQDLSNLIVKSNTL